MSVPPYQSQEWLFDVAAGRSDLDLAVSGMESRTITALLPELDPRCGYDIDRGAQPLRELIGGLYGVGGDQVLITHGAQEALYLLYAAFLDSGDEVIARSPGWQQTIDLPLRFGAHTTTVGFDLRDTAAPDADGGARVAAAIGPATRAVVLNSPHNPTGLTWPDRQWAPIADAVAGRDVLVVNDEEYLTDLSHSIVRHVPGSCAVSSLSKVFGYPGLRLGWLVGPKDVVARCVNYRRYTTISNSPLLESLALTVLRDRVAYLAEYHARLDVGWRVFADWASGQAALKPVTPQGTPFAFCAVRLPGTSSLALCNELLDRQRLLLMPGDVFGAPGYVRISYARPPELLADGLHRLGTVLAELSTVEPKVAEVP